MDKGGGVHFRDFVRTSFMDGLLRISTEVTNVADDIKNIKAPA